MKNVKRLLALILALAMLFTMTACGDKGGNPDGSNAAAGTSAPADDNPYNLDYSSADLQPMTDERASKDTLAEAGEYYMTGLRSDAANFTKLTYKDVAEHIGVDASDFQYFESYGQYRYNWYVEGSEGPSLMAVFDTNGNLSMVTSSVS